MQQLRELGVADRPLAILAELHTNEVRVELERQMSTQLRVTQNVLKFICITSVNKSVQSERRYDKPPAPSVARVGFLPPKTCFCQTWGLNQIKPVKSGKNQNVGIMGWYQTSYVLQSAVCYLKHANVPHINHQSSFFKNPVLVFKVLRLSLKTGVGNTWQRL